METSLEQKQAMQHAPDRRAEVRKPANGTVDVYLDGSDSPIRARLVDISPHGVRIRLPQACVRPGDKIRLRYPWGEVHGHVMWCAKTKFFEAGLFLP